MELDKAGERYWENVWLKIDLQQAIIPELRAVNNYFNYLAHRYFKAQFKNIETKEKKILEVGCGNSVWLPYFAKEWGMNVTGLDYSQHGCWQERKILEREGIKGEIVCSDFFSPPEELKNSFDFVASFGVVEHFKNTADALKALSVFLKPNGVLITFIPNLTGLYGFLQKHFNRPVYDIHVLLDKNTLTKALTDAGLEIINIQYSGSIGLSLNLDGIDKPIPHYRLKKFLNKIMSSLCKIVWLVDLFLFPVPAVKPFSMGVLSFARKKS